VPGQEGSQNQRARMARLDDMAIRLVNCAPAFEAGRAARSYRCRPLWESRTRCAEPLRWRTGRRAALPTSLPSCTLLPRAISHCDHIFAPASLKLNTHVQRQDYPVDVTVVVSAFAFRDSLTTGAGKDRHRRHMDQRIAYDPERRITSEKEHCVYGFLLADQRSGHCTGAS
jgi:hypothetical protein